jgi:dTMP kinase
LLITFEGIDGSGKSTQIELLRDYLTKIGGKKVSVFREPGGTEVSEQIREILLDAKKEIHPVTELLLFSSARSQLMVSSVLPALEKGEIVILDRFYDSTLAYQGYGRECLSVDEIKQINRIASHEREPDITFYLRIPLELSLKRTGHLEKDRMESAGPDFFEKVIKGYDEIAKQEDRFKTIDATPSPQEIHARILELLSL